MLTDVSGWRVVLACGARARRQPRTTMLDGGDGAVTAHARAGLELATSRHVQSYVWCSRVGARTARHTAGVERFPICTRVLRACVWHARCRRVRGERVCAHTSHRMMYVRPDGGTSSLHTKTLRVVQKVR